MIKYIFGVVLIICIVISAVEGLDPDSNTCDACPSVSALSCCTQDAYLHCYYDSWEADYWSCGTDDLYCCEQTQDIIF